MIQAELIALFEQFKSANVLVIGDLILDAYQWGDVNRISPEAPVPIVSLQKGEVKLGGAANVAANLKALQANVFVAAAIGNDASANQLLNLLQQNGIDTSCILKEDSRRTSTKTRVISNNQHLLRIDDESTAPVSEAIEQQLILSILRCIETNNIGLVLFEDYDKGSITPTIIETVVAFCNARNIVTAVDPKFRNFWHYNHVTLFKPNLKELREGLALAIDSNLESLHTADIALKSRLSNRYSLITLSSKGVFFSSESTHTIVPAHIRNISDISGAGDTVISVAALSLACGATIETASKLANLAGGLVCEKAGVVAIDPTELFSEAIKP